MKVKVKSLSRVGLSVTPWTVAHQAPPSVGFSKREYWSGLTFPCIKAIPSSLSLEVSTREREAGSSKRFFFFFRLVFARKGAGWHIIPQLDDCSARRLAPREGERPQRERVSMEPPGG